MLLNLRFALIRLLVGKDLGVIANMRFAGNSTITPPRRPALYHGCHFDMRERTEPLVLG